jgi:hypothetical protein
VTTNTQPASMHLARLARSPLFLALIVALANAPKPVVVDDTAYLTYARHIAEHPLDPYGFEIFWYAKPDPAMRVLAPPVVLYWLGIGIGLFGEHPALLKLWLFPFVWVFAWAVRELLRRFARGTESRVLPLIVLSPAVLPTVNLMLDIPALGLGLAAMVIFILCTKRDSWRLAVAAGLLAALALQTKYTALLIPPVIGWYGLTQQRIRLAVIAIGVAIMAFAVWELLLVAKYGESHFVYHASEQQLEPRPGESALSAFLREKANLTPGLAGQVGCLGIGVGLLGGAALGIPRRWLGIAAGSWAVGFALIALFPFWRPDLNRSVPSTLWAAAGWSVMAALAGCGILLRFRFGRGLRIRPNSDTLFLAGWVLLEFAGYYALTPFPAARRVIGFVVVGGLLAARAVSRVERIRPLRQPPGWLIGFGVAAGIAVAALDTLDAFPEKWCAKRAAVVAADLPEGATVWFVGHWGFQYYCERWGMKPVVPGQSVLMPGDMLVLPIPPDEKGFYRPHTGTDPLHPPAWAVEQLGADIVWDDWIAGQTVPNFYGGANAVVSRDNPRLRVRVYRIREMWVVR